jgi:aminoglycoside 2'-N-acetyltransferase I
MLDGVTLAAPGPVTMTAMGKVQIAHTSELAPATLAAARALLYHVFEGELTDSDWEHSLGGVHALAWDGTELVGHASVIQRRLLHGGRALRAGYVEGVGVHPDAQRRGHGTAMMRALEVVIRRAYEVGALASTDEAFALYRSCGWQRWTGAAAALTPNGVIPTPDDADCIWVLPVSAPIDLSGELVCDWRDGDVW